MSGHEHNDPMMDRRAGHGRYAQVEREQRWVLRALPEDLGHPVAILDLYIPGTRLRLRRMQTGTEVVFKLGQKVRPEPEKPEIVKLTNMYLSEREYDTMARIGGSEVRKTRRSWTPAERPMVVDDFQGRLAGLIMAEVELSIDQPRLDDPPLAVAHVTDDDRFSGGRLAETSAEELTQLLVSLGPIRR
jgi:hypothetical protein